MRRSATYKMILTALLSALGVVGGSMFEFTIGVAKVAPMQHLINLISGVLVGPWWAVTQAFITSLIRNILGTGTVLAFPGSMIGAIVAYPVAKWLMGANGALWLFVPSFFLSALVGVVVGYLILLSMWQRLILPQLKKISK